MLLCQLLLQHISLLSCGWFCPLTLPFWWKLPRCCGVTPAGLLFFSLDLHFVGGSGEEPVGFAGVVDVCFGSLWIVPKAVLDKFCRLCCGFVVVRGTNSDRLHRTRVFLEIRLFLSRRYLTIQGFCHLSSWTFKEFINYLLESINCHLDMSPCDLNFLST